MGCTYSNTPPSAFSHRTKAIDSSSFTAPIYILVRYKNLTYATPSGELRARRAAGAAALMSPLPSCQMATWPPERDNSCTRCTAATARCPPVSPADHGQEVWVGIYVHTTFPTAFSLLSFFTYQHKPCHCYCCCSCCCYSNSIFSRHFLRAQANVTAPAAPAPAAIPTAFSPRHFSCTNTSHVTAIYCCV